MSDNADFKEAGILVTVRDVVAGVLAFPPAFELFSHITDNLITQVFQATDTKTIIIDAVGLTSCAIFSYQAGKQLVFKPIRQYLGKMLNVPVTPNNG